MNCAQFSQITGWECSPAGDRTIRATAPLTLGNDGQHASFYLASPDESSYFITDGGETAMHASSFGIELTKSRLNAINNSVGATLAKFNDDWSITSRGPISLASDALWDAAKLAMSLSFLSTKWKPKFNQIRFRSLVERVLVESLGRDKVQRSVKVQGMSGHTVEFPFAVYGKEEILYYVEPIALHENRKIDWGLVYQVHGKLSDVKQADQRNSRVVIFEDGAPDLDFGRAATLLAQAASIQQFHSTKVWADRLAA